MNFGDMIFQLAQGFGATLEIFFFTLIFALPLGMVFALLRLSRSKVISALVRIYISIMRGTPLVLQMIVVYFGPWYLFHIKMPRTYRFAAIIIAFVLNYAGYFAEIYRSGIQAVPKGQYEAAKVLGYSKTKTFFRIILPQVMKNVLPPITNETITLVKDTSLAFALSYVEMFTVAKQIAAAHTSIMALMVAGLFYYVFNLLIAGSMSWIEKKLNYYR